MDDKRLQQNKEWRQMRILLNLLRNREKLEELAKKAGIRIR